MILVLFVERLSKAMNRVKKTITLATIINLTIERETFLTTGILEILSEIMEVLEGDLDLLDHVAIDIPLLLHMKHLTIHVFHLARVALFALHLIVFLYTRKSHSV